MKESIECLIHNARFQTSSCRRLGPSAEEHTVDLGFLSKEGTGCLREPEKLEDLVTNSHSIWFWPPKALFEKER